MMKKRPKAQVFTLTEQYEIIIRNETARRDTPIAAQPNVNGESAVASPITKKTASSEGKNQNALASAIVATSAIKPYVQQMISMGISQIEMGTGSAELQRKAQAFNTLGSSALGIVAAGAVGGIGGALSAAAMMAVQSAIEAGVNYVSINNRKILETESLQLQKSRVGMVSNRSRGGGVV